MLDKLATLTALWALMVAPNLCRAGLLTACCFPSDRPTQARASGDDCCNHTEPQSAPTPKPEPRKCDSCAQVCDATVKTPDDSGRLSSCLFISADHEAPSTEIPILGEWTRSVAAGVVFETDLPFPRSDIPLLI